MDMHQQEVDLNYKTFQDQLSALLPEHRGKFALLHHQKIVDFFKTSNDAIAAGKSQFPDGMFSVQEVTDRVIDLGFFSHAMT